MFSTGLVKCGFEILYFRILFVNDHGFNIEIMNKYSLFINIYF